MSYDIGVGNEAKFGKYFPFVVCFDMNRLLTDCILEYF